MHSSIEQLKWIDHPLAQTEQDDWESEEPVAIAFDSQCLYVKLYDSRVIGAPMWWYPRLLKATAEQRCEVEFSRLGLHWDQIDEDISIGALLEGRKSPEASAPGSTHQAA